MFSRRSDGRLARVAPYRRMMPFLMPGRNESAVYFEQTLDLSRTGPWLEAWNRTDRGHATLFHLVLHALATVLRDRPQLNRFVVGRRIFDRKDVEISFAAKKAFRDDAPLATVKRRFDPAEDFAAMVADLGREVVEAKSDKKSQVDKELSVFLRLPGIVLAAAVRLLHFLDRLGLAPRSLTDSDPMYASAFVANLGSLKLEAAYHHLYEHGNCPLFVTIGRIAPRPFVEPGAGVELRPSAVLKYTYDERVEDGFYAAQALALLQQRLEDPASWLGELGTPA